MAQKIFIAVFVVSLLINLALGFKSLYPKRETKDEEMTQQFPYLAKRIFIEQPNDVIINFIPLRSNIREYIAGKKDKIGFYFEYLPTGIGVGVNDRELFFRASLIKVPTVMSAYELIEQGMLGKGDELIIEEHHLDKTYGSLWKRGAASKVTVEEAIRLAIIESDNTAYEVLSEKVNDLLNADVGKEKDVDDVYDYLDIPTDSDGLTQDITPRNYSSILRSLFFSAFLSYNDSNELLWLLSQSNYTEGIAKPLLGKVQVAHKFGIRNLEPDESLTVHSDCGVIYYPKRPYLLCVMVGSGDKEITGKYMQEISDIVYKFISTAKGGN